MPTAIVTGTSTGFGRSTAERLVRLGWTVIGTLRDPMRATGDEGWETIGLDLRDPDSIEAVAVVCERIGALDALVSNAGFVVFGPLEEFGSEEFRDQLEVNLVGTMALVRVCLPALRTAGGVVVQVSSVAGQCGYAALGAYCASKFGLEAATEAMAEETAAQGVRFVIVEPGPFRTQIGDKAPQAARRDATGLYDRVWQEEVDDFIEFLRDEAEDPEIAVDAIVAAATLPHSPFRIPVGDGVGDEMREHARQVLADIDRAEAFLAANRRLGSP